MNYLQRGAALGEAPLPSAPRSVFDYLSAKDRERLQGLSTGSLSIPTTAASIPPTPAPTEAEPTSSIPRLDPSVAQQALKGFKPFEQDPAKSARYTVFLKSQLGDLGEEDLSGSVRPGPYQSKEDFYKELREFAKAATIFKPVSGALGGRFASAKVAEKLLAGKDGLFVPDLEGGYLGDKALELENVARKEDPMLEAARAGMFGPLTRTVKEWVPARLLCKRFGIKEPVRDEPVEMEVDKQQDWRSQLPSQEQILATQRQGPSDELIKAATSSFRGSGKDISNIGLGEDDEQGKEILTYTKPERDIFKAIFESDEEEEPEEEVKEVKGPSMPPGLAVPTANAKTPNVDPGGTLALDTYVPPEKADSTGVVDLATFRPTFKPKNREESKGEKKEKKKSSKKGKAILSFETEDGEGLSVSPMVPKKQKKVKKGKHEVAVDDEAMWVEKPAPVVTSTFAVPFPKQVEPKVDISPSNLKAGGGRMKASDFM